MCCREKHDGACINTHMVCSDRQTGSLGRWDLDSMETKRKERKKKRGRGGRLMTAAENEQVLWLSKKSEAMKVKICEMILMTVEVFRSFTQVKLVTL